MNYNEKELVRSLEINDNTAFLLGAGCSIASGCMSASKLIMEFKRRIFCDENSLKYDTVKFEFNNEFDIEINKYFEKDNAKNEYAFYFEKCFPSPIDRIAFIKNNFLQAKPTLGYLCFAHYLISRKIKYVLTTNFDGLVHKAIIQLNSNYDIGKSSDSLKLTQECKLNLIELHGDYNYDLLKNTEQELKELSNRMTNDLLKINVSRIIVIGYSGSDSSVMNFLRQYAELNPKVEIVRCIIEEGEKKESINNILSLNINSKYCKIQGFDELFYKLYQIYFRDNKKINEIIYSKKINSFELINKDYSQNIQMNFFKIKKFPNIYRINKIHTYNFKEINKNNQNVFCINYESYIYCIGEKKTLCNLFAIDEKNINIVYLKDCELPMLLKCKILKELILKGLKKDNISRYGNNLFITDGQKIQTGLKVRVDTFNQDFIVVLEPNYFVIGEISDDLKYEINNKKTFLYAKENFDLRTRLIKKIIQTDFIKFYQHCIKLDLDNCIISNNNKICDCGLSLEPLMTTQDNKSVNQISLVYRYGPINHLFSFNKIRVGIFCAHEDLIKFKTYVNHLINGTNSYSLLGMRNFSQFPGFKKVFRKDIEFLWDSSPKFSLAGIFKEITKGRKLDEIIYSAISKYYYQNQMDIILIYLSDSYNCYKKDGDYDLHDKLKLMCLNKYKTQFLEESSIDSKDSIAKRIYNLALGIYTKTIGIPWYPFTYQRNTIYIGMSFGISMNGICIGCSQMFDSMGRGMQLIVSKVTNKFKKNQFLNKNEAYELGKKIRDTYYKSSKIDEIKRIVIHRASPFKNEEIEGFRMAFCGIEDFELIEIYDTSSFNAYKIVDNQCYGFPLKRGTIIKNATNQCLLWLDGSIIEKDIDSGRNYRNSKRGMGRPLIVKKTFGTQSIDEVVDSLMFLSKMDFNSGDVIYSKLPVTIKYSSIVCDLLKQGEINDELISFEYIM